MYVMCCAATHNHFLLAVINNSTMWGFQQLQPTLTVKQLAPVMAKNAVESIFGNKKTWIIIILIALAAFGYIYVMCLEQFSTAAINNERYDLLSARMLFGLCQT